MNKKNKILFEGDTMKAIIYFMLLFTVLYLFSDVSFDLDFNLDKIDPDDELVNLQLFDFDNDGTEEIMGCFNNFNESRIVIYTQTGETLLTYTEMIEDYDQILGYSYAFKGQDDENMLLLVLFQPYFYLFQMKLLNLDTFTVVDSIEYSLEFYGAVVENVMNVISTITNDERIFFIGIDIFSMSQEEVSNSVTYKFSLSDNQIEFVEEIADYGAYYAKNLTDDNIIALGEYSAGGVGACPYCSRSYCFGLLSNNFISDVIPVFSTGGSVSYSDPVVYSHYPYYFTLLSKNIESLGNCGALIYYKTNDSSEGTTRFFKCYNSDFSELLWEDNFSYIGTNIFSSTCVSVNNEDHYVLYFNPEQLEIRDLNNGYIVHHQETLITPFKIFRKNNGELLFFEEYADQTGYNVYKIDGEILVSSEEDQLEVAFPDFSIFPNPFNPSTTIEFNLRESSKSKMNIYNLKGQKIKELLDETLSAGNHQVYWNGRDENNQTVSSGIYFVRLVTDKEMKTRKILMMK